MTSPPTMTIASGRSISVPWSRRTSKGSNPRLAVAAVISLGRTRPMLASRTATGRIRPEPSNARVCVTRTRLYCTAMPKRPMSPTSDDTFHVSPVRSSATMPPTKAMGTVPPRSSCLDGGTQRDEQQDEHPEECTRQPRQGGARASWLLPGHQGRKSSRTAISVGLPRLGEPRTLWFRDPGRSRRLLPRCDGCPPRGGSRQDRMSV